MRLCDILDRLNSFTFDETREINTNMIMVSHDGTVKVVLDDASGEVDKKFNVVTSPQTRYIEIKGG